MSDFAPSLSGLILLPFSSTKIAKISYLSVRFFAIVYIASNGCCAELFEFMLISWYTNPFDWTR